MLIFIAGAGLLFRILTIEYALLYPEIRRFLWNLDFSECGIDGTLVSAEDDRIVGVEKPECWTAVFLHELYCYDYPNRFSFSGFPGPDVIKSMEIEIPEYLNLKWDTPKMSQSTSMYVTPQGRRIYVLDSIHNPAFFLTVTDTIKAPVYRIRDYTVKVWEMSIRLTFLDEDGILRDSKIVLLIYFQRPFKRSNTRRWTKVHLTPWTGSDSIPPPILYLMEGAYSDDDVWYILHGHPRRM